MTGAAVAARSRLDRGALGTLAFGHLAADFCQGIVPPLLPFLVSERGYSYAAAASLLLFSSLGSSLLQPLLGLQADRLRHAAWMMSAGVVFAGAGIALVGLSRTYLETGAALGVVSVGVALFHPEAARCASLVAAAGGRAGVGMSVFALGGTSGWALAPLLVTPLVLVFGLQGVLLAAALPAAAALLLVYRVPALARVRTTALAHEATSAGDNFGRPDAWGAFALTAAAASLRTGVQFGLRAFVPLYAWQTLHASHPAANATTSVLLVAGAAGAVAGGRLSDRYGFPRIVVVSLAAVPLLVAPLAASPLVAVFGLMAAIGIALDANFYPLVIIAQRALPRRVGFASGVMLGGSIGAGALIASLLGVLADHLGLPAALLAIAGVAAGAFFCAVPIRAPRPVTAAEPPAPAAVVG